MNKLSLTIVYLKLRHSLMAASKIKLSYKDRDKLFKKYFTELKIKVALNWFELIALLLVLLFVSFKLFTYAGVSDKITVIIMALVSSIVITLIFSYIRKYKLSINRFDKENIYIRLSTELIEECKS